MYGDGKKWYYRANMSRLSEIDDHLGRLRAVKAAGGFFSEFWKFAAKGNIFDLAVGVILGTAFSQIVNSLVNNIITPLISLATGNVNFSTWSYTLREPTRIAGTTTPELVLNYGHLMQATLNFLIVGMCIFIFYKLFSKLRQRLERNEAEAPPEPISTQEKLLCEIRDILKEQKQTGEK